MKRRSFRFRLALISVALSGLVLLVFGLVAWWALSQSQLRSLDNELTNFGYRFASRSGPNVSGERQQETLVSMVGAEVASYRFFAILNQRGKLLFHSTYWPETLDAQRFPAGADSLDPQPELVIPEPKPGEVRPDRELRPVFEPRFYTERSAGHRYRTRPTASALTPPMN